MHLWIPIVIQNKEIMLINMSKKNRFIEYLNLELQLDVNYIYLVV